MSLSPVRPFSAERGRPHPPAVLDLEALPGGTPADAAPLLSIVVPAYQEEDRIGPTLLALADHLERAGRTQIEVLVVAATRPDGSTDRTPQIVGELGARFRDLRLVRPGARAGKGRDVRVGMLAARGLFRVFMDADLATPLHHLDGALALALAGHPAVIGVRDLTSSHRGLRKAISELGNLLVRALLLPAIPDTQCGFKLFSGTVTEQVFRRSTIDGWGFDMEVLAISRGLGHRITTVPIPDWTDVSGGTFSDAPLAGALRTLQDLLLVKYRAVTGRYRRLPSGRLPRYDAVPVPARAQDLRLHPLGRAL